MCIVDRGGCGRCGIAAGSLEELISEAVLLRLSTPVVAQAIAAAEDHDDSGFADAIAADEAKLIELGDLWDAGEITRAEWLDRRRKVGARDV